MYLVVPSGHRATRSSSLWTFLDRAAHCFRAPSTRVSGGENYRQLKAFTHCERVIKRERADKSLQRRQCGDKSQQPSERFPVCYLAAESPFRWSDSKTCPRGGSCAVSRRAGTRVPAEHVRRALRLWHP